MEYFVEFSSVFAVNLLFFETVTRNLHQFSPFRFTCLIALNAGKFMKENAREIRKDALT